MRALQAVGAGLLLVVFDLTLGDPGIDVVPDPLGWALAAYGVTRLPPSLAWRGPLLGVAVMAGLISVALWLPSVAAEVVEVEPSLQWALDLPSIGFVVGLAASLRRAAGDAGDVKSRQWWTIALVGSVITVLLPAVVYGLRSVALVPLAALIALGTLVLTIVLCLRHADRPWALDPAALHPGTPQGRPS